MATSDGLLTSTTQRRWVINSLMESIAKLVAIENNPLRSDPSSKTVTLYDNDDVNTQENFRGSQESPWLNAGRSTSFSPGSPVSRDEQSRPMDSSMTDLRQTPSFADRRPASQELSRTRDYTKEELSCLGVQFPPFFVSTHGLTRPSSPDRHDAERSVKLIEYTGTFSE